MLYAPTSALPVIAAALALSSTPVLAQQVTPPAQPVADEPAPAPSTATQPDEPSTPAASSMEAASPPAATAEAQTKTTRPVHHSTYVAASKRPPAPAPVEPPRKTLAARAVAPVAPAAPAPTRTSHVTPVIDLSAKPPLPITRAAAKPARKKDPTLPIAGGALAFLAIGGAAVAMTRRREDDEGTAEDVDQQPVEAAAASEPVIHEVQPAIVGPSAFAWDRAETHRSTASTPADRGADETWVERAYRGPTADNPSLSLRTRLKRAAFFDKRERDVAAGVAEPVDTDAGLPDAMADA